MGVNQTTGALTHGAGITGVRGNIEPRVDPTICNSDATCHEQ